MDKLFLPSRLVAGTSGPDSHSKPLASLKVIGRPETLSKPLASIEVIGGTDSDFRSLASLDVVDGPDFFSFRVYCFARGCY